MMARFISFFFLKVYFLEKNGHNHINNLCLASIKHLLSSIRLYLTHVTHVLKMTDKKQINRAKNLATISFVGSSDDEVRTIAHLKHVKQKTGLEIKAQILRAVASLTDLYSIGDDPNCTRGQFEDATVNFIIDLTSQLNRGLSYAKNHKYQIELPPKSWTQFCQIADSIFREDLGRPSLKTESEDLSKSPLKIVKQEQSEKEDEKDEDESDLSNLSDEDYLIVMQSRIDNPKIKTN